MDGRGGVTIAKLTQHAQNDCFNAYLLDWIFSAVSSKDARNKNLVYVPQAIWAKLAFWAQHFSQAIMHATTASSRIAL